METVRREVRLPEAFDRGAIEAAFDAFRLLYHVAPTRISCSPDVLERFCLLFAGGAADAYLYSARPRFRDVVPAAAVLPPGTIAFEGEVCEERMGDW